VRHNDGLKVDNRGQLTSKRCFVCLRGHAGPRRRGASSPLSAG